MKLKIKILSVVLALAFTSCLKNEIVYNTDDLDFRPWKIAAPIAKIHVPLYKSIGKWVNFDELDLTDINGEKVICVRYTHSETIEWDDEDLGITDISSPYGWGYELPGDISSLPNSEFTHTISAIAPIETAKADAYITEAELTSFKFKLSITIPDNLTGDVTITIPQLKDQNGADFTRTYNNLQGVHNVPVEILTDYKLETPDKQLQMDCTFTVKSTGGGSTAGSIMADVSFLDIEVDYMKGYFGELTYKENVEMDIDFFDELDFEGTIGIKGIKMDVVATNRSGLPINVKADAFFINEGGLNEHLELDPPFDFYIDGATVPTEAAVSPFFTTMPDIEFVNGQYPSKLRFDVEGKANPDGNPNGDVTNFIVKSNDDHLANVDFTLTVPLYIKMSAYNRADTVAFDYNKIIDNDEKLSKSIHNFTLTMIVDNSLPFAINLSADAIDEAGNIVEEDIMNVNINAKQKNPPIEIKLTQDLFEKFRAGEVKNIVLRSKAQTANEDYVRVTENDYLDIVVSTRFEANIPKNIF